jgi:hypothetical protein
MKEQITEVIENKIKNAFWGYEVYYHPDYEDFVCTHKEIKKKILFIFPVYENKIDYIIKKKNMKWEERNIEIIHSSLLFNFSNSWKEYFHIYVNEEHRVVLYR